MPKKQPVNSFVLWLVFALSLTLAGHALAQDQDDFQRLLDEARYQEVLEEVSAARARGGDTVALAIYAAKAYDKLMRQSGLLKTMRLTKKLRAELTHVLELQPEHPYALEELADFYHYAPAIGGGDKKKADDFIQRLKAADPVRYHIMKGRHAHDGGDLPGAIEHFEQAKTLAPENAKVLAGLGNVLIYDKQFARAFTLFDGLIENGSAAVETYYQAGRAAQLGEMETAKAYAYLRHYIQHAKPASRYAKEAAHYRLGHLYKADGKITEARTEFERALALNPKLKQAKAALKELDNE